MNAPQTAANLAKPTIEILALSMLVPSNTHIQQLRRARFDQKLIGELAESIKEVGVLQPILARPLAGEGAKALAKMGKGTYEIVAGERRYLAAKKAGLTEIQASVRELTDDQVLEVQLIENLQREVLHELEEAEGYEELMKLKGIDSETVADMVGRSKSYVEKRRKLLALGSEARKAFYAGEMDASTALLIARIPHPDLQMKAMKDLQEQKTYGDVVNFKDAQRFIHEHYMLQLKAAPFKTDDATLLPKAGPCTTCPKRTGNQKDLFGDVKSGDVCTDPKCFAEKRAAGEAKLIAEHKAKGVEVIVGEAAKRIFPYSTNHASGGYHLASEKNWSDSKGRKYGDMVEKIDIKLVVSPQNGELIKVVHSSALPAVKKAKQKATVQRAKAKSGPDANVVAERIVRAIHDKYDGELNKTLLPHLVNEVLVMAEDVYINDDDLVERLMKDHWGLDSLPSSAYGSTIIPKSLQGFDAKKLARFSIEVLAMCNLLDGSADRAKAICDALKIDRKKIEKQVAEEAKAAAKAKPAEKPAVKAKKK